MTITNRSVIQVVFGKVFKSEFHGGHGHTYSYRVPEGLRSADLWLYDRVIVPPNWAHPYSQIATIVAWGRGEYDGPLQDIEGIVEEAPAVRFSVAPGGRVMVSPPNTQPVTPDPYAHFERELAKLSKRINNLERFSGSANAVKELQRAVDLLGDQIDRHIHTF